VTSATRTWTDGNRDYIPQCDLLNVRANGECGDLSNANFGTVVTNLAYDTDTLTGFGKRNINWEFSAGVQRELVPRVSADLTYFRRWYGNFPIVNDLAIGPADFDKFTITAPVDARLPDGGGYAIPGTLYNVNPSKASVAANNFVTLDSNYAPQNQTSNAIALNVSARPRNGFVIQGGFNTNNTSFDYCSLRAAIPELVIAGANNPTNPYCSYSSGWLTRFTALGSYTIPKIDAQIGGTVRSDKGAQLAANWAAPNSAIAPSLGRNLSNNAPTATVNLITPGTLYGDRVNELDLRFAKIIRIGRTRTNVGLDVYNLFNSAAVLTYNQTFVPASATSAGSWLTPNSVLQARFFKVSAQIDF